MTARKKEIIRCQEPGCDEVFPRNPYVAPIGLQEQFLKVAGERPVIISSVIRELVKDPDGGEDKVNFIFDGWKQLFQFYKKI